MCIRDSRKALRVARDALCQGSGIATQRKTRDYLRQPGRSMAGGGAGDKKGGGELNIGHWSFKSLVIEVIGA